MVPKLEQEVIVVAAFRRSDLVRLHTLLVVRDSPFVTPAEQEERDRDVHEHEVLRRYLQSLL